MNFVRAKAKFIPPFQLFLTHSPLPPPLFLHSQAQCVGCQSSPKTKSKPSNGIESKKYVEKMSLSINGKGWCCSFLMVCNCNTA